MDITVGITKTLFLNTPEKGVTKAFWSSNDPYTVDIISQNAAYLHTLEQA